jgi:hypothetical protein
VLGVFWANYAQIPREPSFYFRAVVGKQGWTNVYEALGTKQSGVIAPATEPVGEKLPGRELPGKGELFGLAETRYSIPILCGRVRGMLLALMFRPTHEVEIRLAYSAARGGPAVPAWDYQAIVANPQAHREYSFSTRMVYKPYEGLDEALALYTQW